mmetsp:Transcript_79458/g.125343  ORF Transcript_79458/g.125343 Transcript_79458/m.125343 type:complete len:261 (-) Transcript_79458:169-951(-)
MPFRDIAELVSKHARGTPEADSTKIRGCPDLSSILARIIWFLPLRLEKTMVVFSAWGLAFAELCKMTPSWVCTTRVWVFSSFGGFGVKVCNARSNHSVMPSDPLSSCNAISDCCTGTGALCAAGCMDCETGLRFDAPMEDDIGGDMYDCTAVRGMFGENCGWVDWVAVGTSDAAMGDAPMGAALTPMLEVSQVGLSSPLPISIRIYITARMATAASTMRIQDTAPSSVSTRWCSPLCNVMSFWNNDRKSLFESSPRGISK